LLAQGQQRNRNAFPGRADRQKLELLGWTVLLAGAALSHLGVIKMAGMVEAGGVEPPSEKRYGSKPTCLAQFRLVRRLRSE
jgi:hypothetical protein